jgi:hypothetical protein
MRVERTRWYRSLSAVTGLIETLAVAAALAWFIRWLTT